jgi:histidine triad (HIT) family protein
VRDCIFCSIIEGTASSQRIYEDDSCVAFMDINPATDGHALVVPRAHTQSLWTIDEEEAQNVMCAALRVAHLQRAALSPDGINILHATGAAAFQTVFHFHLHVIPRYLGDPIRLPWMPRPGDRSKIATVAELIRRAAHSGEESVRPDA